MVGGLATACFAKVYGVAFLGRPRSDEAAQAREVPQAMQSGMALLGCRHAYVIGVAPGLLLGPAASIAQELIPRRGCAPASAATLLLVHAMDCCLRNHAAAAVCLLIPRIKRVTPTWACGMPGLDSRMQYTSTAFSKPLRKVFAGGSTGPTAR